MHSPVRLGAPARRANGFGLASVDPSIEPFRSLGDEVTRMARSIRVNALLTTHGAEDPGAEVLATWDDGSAALFRAYAGNGQLVAWNGGIEGSSLPRSTFFVALARELALQLTLATDGRGEQFPVGKARVIEIPPGVDRGAELVLVGQDGETPPGFEVVERAEGTFGRWNPVSAPGVYRVRAGGESVLVVASACPPGESDLRRADAAALLADMRSGGEPSEAARTVTVRGLPGSSGADEKVETWPWLIVAGIVVMMAEMALLKAFRV
jgi:hypothetical protein